MLGMVAQLKDYRLAYFLNANLSLHLKKYDDFQLAEAGGKYSWYCYNDAENEETVFLITNHHPDGKLIPSQKMDYFFLLKNIIDDKQVQEMVSKIRRIPNVLAVFLLEMKKIKNLDLIIESIEMHEMEQLMKRSDRKRNPDKK